VYKRQVLIRTYLGEQAILRCGLPREEAEWRRLEKALQVVGA
jgi:hypothetical protein